MARNLTRNTKVYVSTAEILTAGLPVIGDVDSSNTFEVKVLDGYDFSQATTTEDITLSEAGATPIRGQKTYNTAQEPVDVSFVTYIRPYENAQVIIDAPEKVLWASLAGSSITTDVNGDIASATTGNAVYQQATGTGMVIDFEESDSNELAQLTVWFRLQNSTYRVDNVNISTAEVDFSIDGIAQVTWSGMGTKVNELPTAEHTTVDGWAAGTDFRAVPATSSDSFLRNKLSTMTLVNNNVVAALDADSTGTLESATATVLTDTTGFPGDSSAVGKYVYVETTPAQSRIITVDDNTNTITVDKAFDPVPGTEDWRIIAADEHAGQEYTIAITGGSLTVENNMDFLTPEELGVVNQPLPGFAGSRAITGSITAYLDTGSYGTAALLNDILEDINSVSNSYGFTLFVGGTAATPKRVELSLATAQLSVPTINVEDVIATEITFAGQGSADAIENRDELTVTYHST